jgi:hypothetical protein
MRSLVDTKDRICTTNYGLLLNGNDNAVKSVRTRDVDHQHTHLGLVSSRVKLNCKKVRNRMGVRTQSMDARINPFTVSYVITHLD